MKNSMRAATSKAVLSARAEASAWITRLHGPNRSPEMEAGLRRWLAECPENAREFEGLTEVWDLAAGGVPARGVPRLQRWERSLESQELSALRALKARPPRLAKIWARAALILVTCGLLAIGAYQLRSAPVYATGIGEQRVVQLMDSTRVSLNSDTRVVVTYRKNERRVRLEKGEAFFEVGKDVSRPFIVMAGEYNVTALGTSFVVRYESDSAAVTLVEGKVAVTSADARSLSSGEGGLQKSGAGHNDPQSQVNRTSKLPELILSPGERVTLPRNAPPQLDRPRIDAVTAWRRGEIMLSDTPLADALAEMNRHGKATIVIDSPAIAGLSVSGLYHIGDSEGFARSVARMYQLEVVEGGGLIHLKK